MLVSDAGPKTQPHAEPDRRQGDGVAPLVVHTEAADKIDAAVHARETLKDLFRVVHVSFNVAPHVRIAKGRAVDAELGVCAVKGIPEPAATLVAEVLNNDPTLRKTVMQAANDILATLPRR